jgi:hypothetical protein
MQFKLELAKKFHNPNVEQLLSSISSLQYAIWRTDYKLNPWNEARADLRQAITSNLIAAQYGKYKVSDFMPYKMEVQKEQTIEDQQMIIEAMAKGEELRQERIKGEKGK